VSRLGIITISKEIKFKYIPDFFHNKIPQKLIDILTVRFKKNVYKYVDIPDTDIKLYVACLPFTEYQLSSTKPVDIDKLCGEILEHFEMEGIKYVVLSQHVKTNKQMFEYVYGSGRFFRLNSKRLLMSLLVDILRKICKIAGTDMSQIDIGIVENSFTEKSKAIINILSTNVKYVTLVTKDVKEAQVYTEKVCEETGLTVRVSEDISKALSSIDVVFVLDDLDKLIRKASLSMSTIVFNLSTSSMAEKRISNIIIDSVNISIPQNIKDVIGPLGEIDNEELIECIISLKLNKNLNMNMNNIQQYLEFNKEFYSSGYKINVLKGFGKPIDISKLEKLAKNLAGSK
jgi:hypothetical protein